MTASEILRIAVTVGTVQLGCNIIANWRIFRRDEYQRALGALSRAKFKYDKEQASSQQQQAAQQATTETSKKSTGTSSSKADKHAKRLKRAEDDYKDALGNVARLHVAPNLITSLVFIVLLRIFGADMKGKVIGVLPFAPFSILRRVTGRGLDFDTTIPFASSSKLVTDTSQACAFMFIYALCTISIKFYVNKLFGTSPPPGSEGISSFLESPQGQKFVRSVGVNPDDLKME